MVGNPQEIGEKFAALRRKTNMSQEDLANELSVSRQAISNWERGRTQPDISTTLRICGFFGVSVDELMRGEKNVLEISGKSDKIISKYDMAIGLFYAVGLFLGMGFFFVIGLLLDEPMAWGASFLGGCCLFLVVGLMSHGMITLFRKDK